MQHSDKKIHCKWFLHDWLHFWAWLAFLQAMWAYWRYSLKGCYSFPWYAASWHSDWGVTFGRHTVSNRFIWSRLLVGQLPMILFLIFDTSWWHISMLWRFVRSGWIDCSVLTWSRRWPILLARIGSRVVCYLFWVFHPMMFHSFGNIWLASYCSHPFSGVMQSPYFCGGFPWILFRCFFLVAPATPSSWNIVHASSIP